MNRRQRKTQIKKEALDTEILDAFMRRINNITFEVKEGETEIEAARKAVFLQGHAFLNRWNTQYLKGKRANLLAPTFPEQMLTIFGLHEEDTNKDAEIHPEVPDTDGGLPPSKPARKRRGAAKKKD
jgi:hypothetical protein